MAGDDTFDMFAIKSYMLGAIISQGTIRPWDGIKGINMEQPWYIQDANETMTFGGRTFGLFSDACGTNITMCWSFIYNKRLAEEWQVKDLYQTVYDGKWTMDKVTELTKDVWVDVNGDSKPDAGDVYGLYTDKWATLDAFMLSHDIHALTKDKDDLLVVDFYNDRVVESFEKVYSLYWENPGTYVELTAPYNYVKNFAAGQGLFSPMYIQYLIEGDMREMKDEYGVLPYPKLNEEQEDYETYLLARFGMLALPMTLTAEKEAVIGEFTEVWSALSHKYLTPALYDVSLTAKGTRDEESIKMLEMIMDSRSYCFSTSLQYGWAFPFTQDKTYRNLIGSSKTKDITSFYESNRETADKYIEDLVAKLEDVIDG